MDQTEIVHNFIDSFRTIPAIIDEPMLKNYVDNIVIDATSFQEFVFYSDRYLKHTKTFQMGYMLHTVASILNFAKILDPVKEIGKTTPTTCFQISPEELLEISKSEGAERYEKLCQRLMDPNDSASQELNEKIEEGRKKEKLDDGVKIKYPLFKPMESDFGDERSQGQDLTEDTEV